MDLFVGEAFETARDFGDAIQFGRTVAGRVHQHDAFVAGFFGRGQELLDGIDSRESDADDGGEAAQLFMRGDAVRVHREDADRQALRQALANRDLDQRGGFARAGRAREDHYSGGFRRPLEAADCWKGGANRSFLEISSAA